MICFFTPWATSAFTNPLSHFYPRTLELHHPSHATPIRQRTRENIRTHQRFNAETLKSLFQPRNPVDSFLGLKSTCKAEYIYPSVTYQLLIAFNQCSVAQNDVISFSDHQGPLMILSNPPPSPVDLSPFGSFRGPNPPPSFPDKRSADILPDFHWRFPRERRWHLFIHSQVSAHAFWHTVRGARWRPTFAMSALTMPRIGTIWFDKLRSI